MKACRVKRYPEILRRIGIRQPAVGFYANELRFMIFLWEHVTNRIWGIAKLFLQSTENSSPNFGPDKCPSRSSLSWAHLSNRTVTPCTPLSTGGWPQLCSPPNSHSCVRLPPKRRNAVKRHTHSSPGDVETLSVLDANRPCLSPGVESSVSTERTNHRQETNGEEKPKKYNTWSWIFRYNHKKSLHINTVYFLSL